MATLTSRTKRQRRSYKDEPLLSHELPSYKDGYNSYTRSRSLIKDTEVGRGQNARADDNGAMSDRSGKSIASPQFQVGYPVAALGQLKTNSLGLVKLALCGTGLYAYTDTTSTLLTGATFTPAQPEHCRIIQMVGRSYVYNGIEQPYYTTNGTSLTMQSSAFPARYPVFYFQRVYCVRPEYPDRIYGSNPLTASDATTTGSEPANYSVGNFATFDVNLSASPQKNAFFIQLLPDSGLVITNLIQKGDVIHVTTLEHGEWEVTAIADLNDNGTVAHTVKQVVKSGGCPAPLSVFISDNDLLFYGGDNLYFYGEEALYQNPRITPKSGRVQSEMRAIPTTLKSKVVGITFQNAEYVFYAAGSYNDRCLVRDRVLNAWSTPYVGWNVSCAAVYYENDGRTRLLAGSSDTTDPRVYELESGSDDAGSAIVSYFGDKATDGGKRGRVKRWSQSNVFYSSIVGSLVYKVYADGVYVDTGTVTATAASTVASGVGTQAVGRSKVGRDGSSSGSTTAVLSDSFFVVEHNDIEANTLEIVYQKGSSSSHYRILGRESYFTVGDPVERLETAPTAISSVGADTYPDTYP